MRSWPCVVSFLGLLFVGCAKPAPEPLYIGHLAPRATPEQGLGQSADQGLLLAVEEVKDDPPLPNRPITVLTPEGQTGDTFPTVAMRLVTLNRVAGLLADTRAAPAEQLCRIAQQYGVPLITSSSLPGSALAPFGFSVGLAPDDQGKYLARYATQELKKTHAVLLVDGRLLISQPLADAFAEEFRKAKGAQVDRWGYTTKEELQKLVAKLSGNADALAFVGDPADLANLREPKSEESVPVLFGGEKDAEAAADWYRATAFALDGSTPRAKEFADKYQARFGRAPDAAAGLAYDAARVLLDGVHRAGSSRPEKVRDQLKQLRKFDSLTGPLSFDDNHNVRRPVFIVRREKEVKVLKRYDPEGN